MKQLLGLIFGLLLIPLVLAQDLEVPVIGKITTNIPLPLIGMILGFLDGGFNPCALSVLFFLIAYLMALGSRKKCLKIGLIYSLMVFTVYFLFMYGFLKIIYIIGYLEVIKNIVGFVLIIFGIVEIKDFFFYGKWFSLEIPKFVKPTIEKLVKAATVSSALLLGLFVSLVEIPCAGAFPMVYITLLASKNIQGVENVLYLALYNLFFILPLIILTLIFYFGLAKVEEAEKKRLELRKYMRLVAGLIMIVLGIVILMRWL
jgi:cytochrome c biogenesis protein CcdA